MTVDDILTPAISEAINNSTSQLTAIQDTQMIQFIRWLNGVFLRSAHTRNDEGGFSFMKDQFPFKTYYSTTLSGPVAIAGPSLPVVLSSNFGIPGRCVIQTIKGALDFIDYTNNAASALTVSTASGAKTVKMAHVKGEKVIQLYPLPSTFAKVDALKVNSFPPFKESTYFGFPKFGTYKQVDNYLLLPYNLPNSDVTLWFEKKANTISMRTAPTDGTTDYSITNIPHNVSRWAVWMTLHHLFQIRRKRSDLQYTQEIAEAELEDFLAYDAAFSTDTIMQFD